MAMFFKGDQVEVCSKEDRFWGSYYEATVMSPLWNDTLYKVQYKNLVEEDHTRPLVEIVAANEVRLVPPPTTPKGATQTFCYLDRVDAFDNDGWWVGTITGRQGLKYRVHFETTGDEIAYPVSRLRNHLEWCNGKWVSCTKSLA